MVVLLIILAILLLIFAVPYGVDVRYVDKVLRLGVKAGPIRVWLLPAKPKKPKTEAQLEKARLRKEKKAAKKAEKKAKKDQDQTQTVKEKKPLDPELLLALLQMGGHAVRRFCRSFTIDRLMLHYVVATRDPYDTAMQYSYLCAGLGALEGTAGKRIRIRSKDIQVGMDFTVEEPSLDAALTVSLCLFRLVHVGVAFAVEFLRWKKKHRQEESAGAIERKDEYGRQQDQRNHGCDTDQDQAAG